MVRQWLGPWFLLIAVLGLCVVLFAVLVLAVTLGAEALLCRLRRRWRHQPDLAAPPGYGGQGRRA